MKTKSPKYLLLIITLIVVSSSCSVFHNKTAGTLNSLPSADGFINDFEDILSENEEMKLNQLVRAYEAETTDQIAVVTVSSIVPYENIYEYSLALAKKWGVGQKGKNNGILIAVSKKLRVIQIQLGLGMETRISNLQTKQVIDEVMIPKFKEDQYYQGIKAGIESLIQRIN